MVKKRLARLAWFVVVVLAFGRPLFRGLGEADMENDEALHTMVAESIVTTGDWMTPHTYVPYLSPDFVEKPPLKFWLVAAPLRAGLLPNDESGVRVWDALFGAIAFLYVFAFGRLAGGPWCGLSAALVLFTFQPLIFDHGLRTNNMDASVVLAYSGGMYHFLRWVRAGSSREGWLHAWFTGAFIYLGLMTKFVAVAFLPAVAGTVALMLPSARARLREAWRGWVVVALGVIALAAPWFIYQTLRSGTEFWQIILGEHVFKRFGAGLDPTHLKPWGFYFQFVFREFSRSHAFWLVAAGSALVLWRTVKEQWVEGALLLFWFWLPVSLISLGSSKLSHYLYAFVPPLALCAGYAVAWAGQLVFERLSRAGRAAPWPRVAQATAAVLLLAAGPALGVHRHDREARSRAAPDADAQELPAEPAGLPGAQRAAPGAAVRLAADRLVPTPVLLLLPQPGLGDARRVERPGADRGARPRGQSDGGVDAAARLRAVPHAHRPNADDGADSGSLDGHHAAAGADVRLRAQMTSAPGPPVRVTAAVPAYNEGDRLPRFLADWVSGGLSFADPVATLIVVDDHSATEHETRQRLAVEAARHALETAGAAHRVEYLRAPRNQGKGASIRAGWHRAGESEDWLGFVDADGAVPAREFWRVAALLHSATEDAVCGSRVKMAGRSVERSLFRHVQGRAFATLVEWLFHFGFYDTQCGFKFFRADRLRPVLARLREDRWLLDIEVLESAQVGWRTIRRGPRRLPSALVLLSRRRRGSTQDCRGAVRAPPAVAS